MSSFIIKASWISLAPHARFDPKYWSRIWDMLDAEGVDPAKITDSDIERAVKQLAADAAERQRQAAALRQISHENMAAARLVEEPIPEGALK